MPVSLEQRIKAVKDWCTVQERSVVPVLVPELEDMARQALAGVHSALEGSSFDDDEKQGAQFVIALLEYQVDRLYCAEGELPRVFAAALERFEQPPVGPVSAQLRDLKKLMLLISGERRGLCEVSRAELSAIVDGIGDSLRDAQFWYYVSSWAFTHREPDYLVQAFEAMLLMPTTFRNQMPFKRTRLMTRILHREATEAEVLHYLDEIIIPQVLSEFREHLLPVLLAQGMTPEPLDEAIARAQRRLANLPEQIRQTRD